MRANEVSESDGNDESEDKEDKEESEGELEGEKEGSDHDGEVGVDLDIICLLLKYAKGLAILTVAKAGALLSYKIGTGLVVARRVDGSWSAPSAAFCSRMHFSLGAGCSAAAGPVGRVLEVDVRAGDRGSGMCYTYSCSKGSF
ncbi:protein YSC84-like [Arachis ipaensis]|uniref:protein YSC84-like n=1 Tax=Arachis ipaensis TaxID=130454 RepID=UPI0007AFD37D|nr:protein YSC84-like [Arachis ipaensis]XP_025635619.1 protein YSC84-like [Arachis hypogaea]